MTAALCGCGCGTPTPVAKRSDSRWGHVRGHPIRFVVGHNGRQSLSQYLARVRRDDSGCWTWTGSLDSGGYGKTTHLGRTQSAHRVVYRLSVGPIPEGLEIDHLCFNRACVNPAHLEAVTPSVNAQRRSARPRLAMEEAR